MVPSWIRRFASSRHGQVAPSLRGSRRCLLIPRPSEKWVCDVDLSSSFPRPSNLLSPYVHPQVPGICPPFSLLVVFPPSRAPSSFLSLIGSGVSFFLCFGLQSTNLVGAFRNDGANGTLPVLNPAELHQLQVTLSPLLLYKVGRCFYCCRGRARLRGFVVGGGGGGGERRAKLSRISPLPVSSIWLSSLSVHWSTCLCMSCLLFYLHLLVELCCRCVRVHLLRGSLFSSCWH